MNHIFVDLTSLIVPSKKLTGIFIFKSKKNNYMQLDFIKYIVFLFEILPFFLQLIDIERTPIFNNKI